MSDDRVRGRTAGNRGVRDPDVLESPLSASWRPSVRERAVLVGIGPGIVQEDLDELAALADSAGAEPVARMVQSRSEPDPATWIGRGKMEDLHRLVHANDAKLVVFDRELTPGHLRTLESRLGVKVIDRTALILDIFALHARSREGKAQVELAQLNYLLPRLRGWGEAMSRLGGGIGTRVPARRSSRSTASTCSGASPSSAATSAPWPRRARPSARGARTAASHRRRSSATRTRGSPP